MAGIARDKTRKDTTQEYFTSTDFVNEVLDKIEDNKPELFFDKTKTFIDNAAGDGQFLTEVIVRKLQKSKCTLLEALSTTYGVELMPDNVVICKKRLVGPNPTQELIDIVNKNIVCANALEYDYSFGEPSGIERWC
jgi:hypothetical protein